MRPTEFPQPLDTLMVATCNVLNLANPGRLFYENQDPYSQTEFERIAPAEKGHLPSPLMSGRPPGIRRPGPQTGHARPGLPPW